MSKINTKDATTTSADSLRIKGRNKAVNSENADVNTSGGTAPKDQLKTIKAQKKDLNVQLKGLIKEENRLKKQLAKSNNKKK